MTNLDSIFKSRDITLPTKVRLVKPMVFPVVMYGCESWTVQMIMVCFGVPLCSVLWALSLSGRMIPPVPFFFLKIALDALSFLSGPTLTSIHDYWKNHSLD